MQEKYLLYSSLEIQLNEIRDSLGQRYNNPNIEYTRFICEMFNNYNDLVIKKNLERLKKSSIHSNTYEEKYGMFYFEFTHYLHKRENTIFIHSDRK